MRMRPILLPVTVAVLAVTGCGGELLDIGKATEPIRSTVEAQVGEAVRSVTCPGKITLRARSTFACVVTGTDGTTGNATVTQINGKGGLSVTAPFLNTPAVESRIQDDLRMQSPRATVACPEVVVVAKGATFRCIADLGPFKSPVTVRQTTPGAFTYKLH
jgi:hypothetical protein